jgi:hypothetical protein
VSQIRLLVDEDAQHRGRAPALRARGVEVATAHEAGLIGVDDDVLLARAANDRCTVYTFNADDFCRLHSQFVRQGLEHAGIVVVPVNANPLASSSAVCSN